MRMGDGDFILEAPGLAGNTDSAVAAGFSELWDQKSWIFPIQRSPQVGFVLFLWGKPPKLRNQARQELNLLMPCLPAAGEGTRVSVERGTVATECGEGPRRGSEEERRAAEVLPSRPSMHQGGHRRRCQEGPGTPGESYFFLHLLFLLSRWALEEQSLGRAGEERRTAM